MPSRVPLLVVGALLAGCAAEPDYPPVAVPAELAAVAPGLPGTVVSVDVERKVVVVYAGPFHVPAAAPAAPDLPHDMVGHNVPLIEFAWPADGWFRGFHITLHDAAGSELPRGMMHHLVGYNLDRRPLIHPGVERLFGVGMETADIVLPEAIGVPMPGGTRLGFTVAWHNESGRDVDGVYVRLVFPYTPERPEGVRIAGMPFHAEVNYQIEGTTAFDLPAGHSEHAFEFTMPIDGGVIAASGHMHDYGVGMRLEDAATGEVLFSLAGRRTAEGTLLGIEQKVFRKWFGLRDARIPLAAGRSYRVVGEYDNPTGKVIPSGAMAHIVGLFAPDDPSRWPPLDPADPELIRDLAVLRGEVGTGGAAAAPAAHVHH